ncbi:Exodeoxyribonuclease V gamma chain [Candidatus Johnevansia muelleri]|uniref:RecBCD enzyme subunit RecC n=1 Tax=Candidatus Johnevansia muelleri TaxID=1495769 RepID=A0A078KEH4_9GAMM|nr:Exodeoxyribonuclease V gamma chain [Candidatus Evansia muelleri]
MFTVIHANNIEDLIDIVIEIIHSNPIEPLETETFIIQSHCMGQWLRLAIADKKSIAASLEFKLPLSFICNLYNIVLGNDNIYEYSHFDYSSLIWILFKLIPKIIFLPEFKLLYEYIQQDKTVLNKELFDIKIYEQSKLYFVCKKIAYIFNKYLLYRYDWINAWSEKKNILKLDFNQQWQPKLLQELLKNINIKNSAFLHKNYCKIVTKLKTRPIGLPSRLFVFGISTLPAKIIEALYAVSHIINVFVFVNNPCKYYWEDVINKKYIKDNNPLLMNWGKQGCNFIKILNEFEYKNTYKLEYHIFRDKIFSKNSLLLHQLQQDILDLNNPYYILKNGCKRILNENDKSIRFICTYSTLIEVEILRDQLLEKFEIDHNLKPNDIIVLAPDINDYTAFINAVFGSININDPTYIPYGIIDKKNSIYNPILICLLELIKLPIIRLELNELLNWLYIPEFRRRFEIKKESIKKIKYLLKSNGVRWGINSEHRYIIGLPALNNNTLRFGIDKIILNYAINNKFITDSFNIDLFEFDAKLIGNLIKLIQNLEHYLHVIYKPANYLEWEQRIKNIYKNFFLKQNNEYELINEAINTLSNSCEIANFDENITFYIVHDVISKNLDEKICKFFYGKVNFATFLPMRNIPFRYTYLLGMNEGNFPRPYFTLSIDIMKKYTRNDDLSSIIDDSYLLLEVLLSTRDCLTISWVKKSNNNYKYNNPSVLINELRNIINIGWTLNKSQTKNVSPIDILTIEHIKQFYKTSFEARQEYKKVKNFYKFTEIPFISKINPPIKLGLNELEKFLYEPFKIYFKYRIKINFKNNINIYDTEPFILDNIQLYNIKNILINNFYKGYSLNYTIYKLKKSGQLPFLGFSDTYFYNILEKFKFQINIWKKYIENKKKEQKFLRFSISINKYNVCFEQILKNLYEDYKGNINYYSIEPYNYIYNNQIFRLFRGYLIQLALSIATKRPGNVILIFENCTLVLPTCKHKIAKIQLINLIYLWYKAWKLPIPTNPHMAFDLFFICEYISENKIIKINKILSKKYKKFKNIQKNFFIKEIWPDFKSLLNNGFIFYSKKIYNNIFDYIKSIIKY